jgi:ferredoxin-type protein NapH
MVTMAGKSYRSAREGERLSDRPQRTEIIKDRKNRKIRMDKAQLRRRIKQIVVGTAFPLVLGAGWLYPAVGYFIPVCMLMGIGLATFRGRSWCNWLCPRGSFEDAWLARISRKRQIPRVLRSAPLRLGVMTGLMGLLTWQVVRRWPDPWAIGGIFVLMLSVTTTVAVILGVVWQQRTWCYLCPIGTMANWVGKNRQPLKMAPELCTQCNLCAKNCPMQLKPAALKAQAAMPNHGDCLKCSLCVESCPQAALAFPGGGRRNHAA